MEKILDRKITVQCLGSGFAAVHQVLIKEDDDEPYWDVQNTGVGRYKSSEEAKIEALDWAKSDEIRFEG